MKKHLQISLIRRLPVYVDCLRRLKKGGNEFISTRIISEMILIHDTQVRKDFAALGLSGTPKVGYHVENVVNRIIEVLNWRDLSVAFLVGAGNLGSALLGYEGYPETGMQIIAAFDTNKDKVGTMINNIQVYPIEKFTDMATKLQVQIGIITTPSHVAQRVADMMVECGFKGIWNFSPRILSVPDDVVVENADLYSGLVVLKYKL
ncbi:MAG: redox-sensing transcriptional repressor Rex [Candidatus Zophobacter franzmannii]|nr:redox-sensing transcriptional repressor Rex [Candidatus Zophobacter franzmannii]